MVGDLFQLPFVRYVESIPQAMMSASTSLHNELPAGKRAALPDIQFGLLNSQKLNGFATQFNGRYFVALGGLVPMALLEFSAYLFSQSGFFAHIGDLGQPPVIKLDGALAMPFFQLAENQFAVEVSNQIGDDEALALTRALDAVRLQARKHDENTGAELTAPEYMRQYDVLLDLMMPRCPVRREHCRYLAAVMAHFFWFHEIAHVTMGHLRSLSSDGEEQLSLYELPDPSLAPAGGLKTAYQKSRSDVMLAMEFDADFEAILMTIGIIQRDIDIETDDFPYIDSYQRVELFIMFLITLFQVFSKHEKRFEVDPGTHPPANIRLFNMIAVLSEMVTEDDELTAAIARGLNMAKVISERQGFAFLEGEVDLAEEHKRIWARINEERRSLVNAYDTYQYGNLRITIAGFLEKVDFLSKATLGPTPGWWED